jgi:hypothetical protein
MALFLFDLNHNDCRTRFLESQLKTPIFYSFFGLIVSVSDNNNKMAMVDIQAILQVALSSDTYLHKRKSSKLEKHLLETR